MQTTVFILRYRLRAFGRGIRDHGFEIFFLGPMIVGGALWVADRHLGHLREPLAQALDSGAISPTAAATASLVLALLLVAISLPATLRELYGHRRADGVLDTLPVPESARFHASLAVELARTLPVLAVLLIGVGALSGQLLPAFPTLAERITRILAALVTLALARWVVALGLVHWRRAPNSSSRWRVAAGGLGLLLISILGLAAPHPLLRLLLLPWLAPAAQLETTFSRALPLQPGAMPRGADGPWVEAWALAAAAMALYLLAHTLYLAWHRRDLEVARQLTPTPGRQKLPRPVERRQRWPQRLGLTRPLAAQIQRDVQLVLRRFSPAVLLCTAFALVIQAIVWTLLLDSSLPALWRQRLAVAGLTLSVLATVSLVPFLLKHELPRLWIEKTTGVDLEQIWRAKLWSAGWLALGPMVTGVLILCLAPGLDVTAKGMAALQLSATTVVVASILGLAVFEIASQPLLGLVFGSLTGLALAALFIFYPQAWWLWLVFYGYVAGQIAGRATRRVRLVEVEARSS